MAFSSFEFEVENDEIYDNPLVELLVTPITIFFQAFAFDRRHIWNALYFIGSLVCLLKMDLYVFLLLEATVKLP